MTAERKREGRDPVDLLKQYKDAAEKIRGERNKLEGELSAAMKQKEEIERQEKEKTGEDLSRFPELIEANRKRLAQLIGEIEEILGPYMDGASESDSAC